MAGSYLHSDRMAAEGVEDVGGPGEVEHHLGRARVLHTINLITVRIHTVLCTHEMDSTSVILSVYITRCSVRIPGHGEGKQQRGTTPCRWS